MTAEQIRRGGDPAAAIDLCRDALARFPGHLSARVTLGWALLDLGRLQEAREEFQIVRQSAPDNFAAIRGLAQLHVLEENDNSYTPDMDAAQEPSAPAAITPSAAPKLAAAPVAPVEPVAALVPPAPQPAAPEPSAPEPSVPEPAAPEPIAAVPVAPAPPPAPVVAPVAAVPPMAAVAPPAPQPVAAAHVPSPSPLVMRLESWLSRVEQLRAAV